MVNWRQRTDLSSRLSNARTQKQQTRYVSTLGTDLDKNVLSLVTHRERRHADHSARARESEAGEHVTVTHQRHAVLALNPAHICGEVVQACKT